MTSKFGESSFAPADNISWKKKKGVLFEMLPFSFLDTW